MMSQKEALFWVVHGFHSGLPSLGTLANSCTSQVPTQSQGPPCTYWTPVRIWLFSCKCPLYLGAMAQALLPVKSSGLCTAM